MPYSAYYQILSGPAQGRECERYIFPTANTTERGDLILEKLVIHGGNRLSGEVEISGAKNAAVAIIPATLLAQDVCRIENIPNISDVSCMIRILSQMGAQVRYINKHTIEINTKTVNS